MEGAKVTPPIPVWLARRVNVRVRASDVGGVARRVVVRAGEQTWQATIVSEAKDDAPEERTEAEKPEKPDSGSEPGSSGSSVPSSSNPNKPSSAPPRKKISVVADPNALVFLPAPLARDADAAKTARVNSAGGVDGFLSPSLATRYGDGGSGIRVDGVGPDGSCRVRVAWRDARSPTLAARLPLPPWARVTINGTFAEAFPPSARDGDVLGVALVAHRVAGATREVLVECVVDREEVEEVEEGADGLEGRREIPSEDFISVVVFSASATTRAAPSSAPRGPPPPPFPPAADVIAAEGAKTTRACDSAGEGERRLARRLVADRSDIFSHDASRGEPPNACGAAPACASPPDDRDVVFVVDASDAMGPEAFRGKTMDALQSLYCASHEGSQSRAAVVLYPAPKSARATSSCGAYQVAIPLARYTPLEWRDLVENLRRDPEACCGASDGASDGERIRLTAAAPLAEALDGAGLELAERGAHDPSKRLVVVVSAGLPSPMVRDESCAEDADPTFASMTRDVPFSRAASDGGEVTACTYLWRYVPAAANRLKASGARIAAVNVAGDAGARESTAGSAAASYLAGEPWLGACDPDGFCSVQAAYGGERGRWVYRGSSEAEKENAEKKDVDEKNAVSRVDAFGFGGLGLPTFASVARLGSADASDRFAYDPGEPETCVANLPSGDAATRGRAVVSFPISAHLVTLHGDADGVDAARIVAPVMCEPSAGLCALEEDAGMAPVVAQCGGGFSAEDAATCLRGMVHAACRAVDEEVRGEEHGEEREEEHEEERGNATTSIVASKNATTSIVASKSSASSTFSSTPSSTPSSAPSSPLGSRDEVCFSDGRLSVWNEGFSSEAMFGVVACNRVCRPASGPDAVDESKRRALGRVEVEVKCEPGRACETGQTRRFSRKSDADARRRNADVAAKEAWPREDKERFADAPAPAPDVPLEEIDSQHGFGK